MEPFSAGRFLVTPPWHRDYDAESGGLSGDNADLKIVIDPAGLSLEPLPIRRLKIALKRLIWYVAESHLTRCWTLGPVPARYRAVV